MDAAQLFRLRTPKRFGGLEADMQTYNDVVTEIGRGCGSTAWVAFISNATVWVACHFPEIALEEVFGNNPDTRFIGALAPLAKVAAAPGGYVVNGKWPFAPGCLHAHWALLAVPLPDGEGSITPGVVLMVTLRRGPRVSCGAGVWPPAFETTFWQARRPRRRAI
jgi:3-hydroxy-9,10-secoandrosta-1,3,5(10)-triene-9,17-dione monooxygenase